MPLYPDTSVLGPNAFSGALAGAVGLGIVGPAQSQSIDSQGIAQVTVSGGAQVQWTGSDVGFGKTMNFAGSSVQTLVISDSTATITLQGGGGLVVTDEGANPQSASRIDFVGAGVTASVTDLTATVTVISAVATTATIINATGTNLGTITAFNFVGAASTGNISVAASTASVTLGGASGLTGSLQFNSASQVSGSSRVFVDSAGNLTFRALTGTETDVAPASGSGTVYARSKANKIMPYWEGPSGLDYAFQPTIYSNKIFWMVANGQALATFTWVGGTGTVTGALAASTWGTTNFSSSLHRVNINPAGASPAGTTGGYRGAAAQWWLGNISGAGGFHFVHRAIIATTPTGSNTRLFFGFQSGTAFLSNNDPSSVAWWNSIGVGKDGADANYQFMHNDGAGTSVKVNTNVPMTQGDVIEVRIFARPNGQGLSGSIGMSLEVLSVSGTGTPGNPGYFAEWTNSASTDLPSATTALNWFTFMQTVTGTIRYAIQSTYIEQDN